MVTKTSVAELLAAGTSLDADEAVAIAQGLISALRDQRGVKERLSQGLLSNENVFLNKDGTVSWSGCHTPAVTDVGIFLHGLLPAGLSGVPEGLRNTIASALFHVNLDLASFDPLEELSRDLIQHERGGRAGVVRGVLERSGGRCAISSSTAVTAH